MLLWAEPHFVGRIRVFPLSGVRQTVAAGHSPSTRNTHTEVFRPGFSLVKCCLSRIPDHLVLREALRCGLVSFPQTGVRNERRRRRACARSTTCMIARSRRNSAPCPQEKALQGRTTNRPASHLSRAVSAFAWDAVWLNLQSCDVCFLLDWEIPQLLESVPYQRALLANDGAQACGDRREDRAVVLA